MSSAEAIANNEDLLTEILVRLPKGSIIKFKCVCKDWQYLISSPCFSRRRNLDRPRSPWSLPTEDLCRITLVGQVHHWPRCFNSSVSWDGSTSRCFSLQIFNIIRRSDCFFLLVSYQFSAVYLYFIMYFLFSMRFLFMFPSYLCASSSNLYYR